MIAGSGMVVITVFPEDKDRERVRDRHTITRMKDFNEIIMLKAF